MDELYGDDQPLQSTVFYGPTLETKESDETEKQSLAASLEPVNLAEELATMVELQHIFREPYYVKKPSQRRPLINKLFPVGSLIG